MEEPKTQDNPLDDTSKKGNSSDVPEFVQVPKAELDRLKDKEKDLLSGFHKKTTALSKERDAVVADRKSLDDARAEMSNRESAFLEDLEWYSSHQQDEWGSYQPKVAKFNIPAKNPVAPLESRMAKLEESIGFLVNQQINATADADSDKLLKYADQAVEKYPLAADRAVLAGIREFQQEQSRYPTHAEVMDIAKELHMDLARKGVRLAQAAVSNKDTGSLGQVASPGSQEVPPVFPDLRNFSKFQQAAEKWLEGRK